jgi:hypothetical protein
MNDIIGISSEEDSTLPHILQDERSFPHQTRPETLLSATTLTKEAKHAPNAAPITNNVMLIFYS